VLEGFCRSVKIPDFSFALCLYGVAVQRPRKITAAVQRQRCQHTIARTENKRSRRGPTQKEPKAKTYMCRNYQVHNYYYTVAKLPR
jgi:hypothetical protein